MLRIKGLVKSPILKEVELTVEKGEIALLLGASGVGKSTLLRLVCGLDVAEAGEITLDNLPLTSVGMVYQHFFLFEHLTAKRNLTIVLEQYRKEGVDEEALRLLSQYELTGQVNQLAANLSGGQKQRLAIARAVAAEPQVLCMDEPTSALDPVRTRGVADAIETLAGNGLSVIVTTHDLSLIDLLPCTVYLMDNGSIIESITSREWLKDRSRAPLLAQFADGVSPDTPIGTV
jgi:ABC-type polar amino acid transport system ATPase subunit